MERNQQTVHFTPSHLLAGRWGSPQSSTGPWICEETQYQCPSTKLSASVSLYFKPNTLIKQCCQCNCCCRNLLNHRETIKSTSVLLQTICHTKMLSYLKNRLFAFACAVKVKLSEIIYAVEITSTAFASVSVGTRNCWFE